MKRIGSLACLLLALALLPDARAHPATARLRARPWRDYLHVVFIDANTGWLADDSELITTVDGGRTWRVLLGPYGRGTPVAASIADLAVLPPATVFFHDRQRDEPALYRSVNGGTGWTVAPLRARQARTGPPTMLGDPQFVTPSTGWALDDSRTTLWHTRSAGESWTSLPAGPGGAGGAILLFFFLDASRGWVVRAEGAGHRVFASKNGGRTWEAAGAMELTPGSILWRLWFLDALTGWAFERGPTGDGLHRTTDGGRTGERHDPGPGEGAQRVERVQFVDRLHGWAVGPAASILRTADGGRTWQRVPNPARADLNGVSFATAAAGWIVGSNSTILRTTNGGQAWTPVDDDLRAAGRSFWDRLLGR